MKKFNEYILNSLNEADGGMKKYIPKNAKEAQELMKVIKNKDANGVFTYMGKKWSEDEAELLLSKTLKALKTMKDLPSEVLKFFKKENGVDDERTEEYNANWFYDLGRVIVFRTAVSFTNNNSNFERCVKDIFTHDSDKRLQAFVDIETVLGIAASIAGYNEFYKKNKETSDEKAQKRINNCKPAYEVLKNQDSSEGEILDAIETITQNIPASFQKFYDEYQQKFEEGREFEQKEITRPDFDWKDPITGKQAKGGSALKAGAHKIANKIADTAAKLGDKIMKSPHNLENDLAKGAIILFKGFMGIKHALEDIVKFFGVGRSMSSTRYIKKYKNLSSKKVSSKIVQYGTLIGATAGVIGVVCAFAFGWPVIGVASGIIAHLLGAGRDAGRKTNMGSKTKDAESQIDDSYIQSIDADLLNEDENNAEQPEKEEKINPSDAKNIEKLTDEQKQQQVAELKAKFINAPNGLKETGNTVTNYMKVRQAYLNSLTTGEDGKHFGDFVKVNVEGGVAYKFELSTTGNLTAFQDYINLYEKSLELFNTFVDTTVKKSKIKQLPKKLFMCQILEGENPDNQNVHDCKMWLESELKGGKFKEGEAKTYFTKFLDDFNKVYDFNEMKGMIKFSKKMMSTGKIDEKTGFVEKNTADKYSLFKVNQTMVLPAINTFKGIKIDIPTDEVVITFKDEQEYNDWIKKVPKAFGGNLLKPLKVANSSVLNGEDINLNFWNKLELNTDSPEDSNQTRVHFTKHISDENGDRDSDVVVTKNDAEILKNYISQNEDSDFNKWKTEGKQDDKIKQEIIKELGLTDVNTVEDNNTISGYEGIKNAIVDLKQDIKMTELTKNMTDNTANMDKLYDLLVKQLEKNDNLNASNNPKYKTYIDELNDSVKGDDTLSKLYRIKAMYNKINGKEGE